MHAPLAERMRPKKLTDYVGQDHLIGEKGALSLMIETGNIPSLLFWGPPGTGKTTLATLIAKAHERPFYSLSAIHSGVKEVREVIEQAKQSGGLFTKKGLCYLLMKYIGSVNRSKILCWVRWRKDM